MAFIDFIVPYSKYAKFFIFGHPVTILVTALTTFDNFKNDPLVINSFDIMVSDIEYFFGCCRVL